MFATDCNDCIYQSGRFPDDAIRPSDLNRLFFYDFIAVAQSREIFGVADQKKGVTVPL